MFQSLKVYSILLTQTAPTEGKRFIFIPYHFQGTANQSLITSKLVPVPSEWVVIKKTTNGISENIM